MPEEIPQTPVTTSAPVSTPVVETSTPPAEPSFSFREFAASQGYEPGDAPDDASLAAKLFDDLKQSKAVAAWAQQNVQPQPKPEPAPSPADSEEWTEDGYFSKRWDVPAYDPQWEAMVESGAIIKDGGKWVPADGYGWMAANPALAQLNSWESKRSAKLQGYLNDNLPKKIYEDLREPLDKRYMTRDQVMEILESRQATSYVSQMEDQLAPYLYTNPAQVPQFGTPQFEQNLTEYGRRFFQTVDDLMALNPNAPQQVLLEKALRFAPPPQPQSQVVAPAAAPPTPPITPAAAGAGKPPTSFIDDALAKAGNRPSGSSPPASPSPDPKRVSAANLKDLIRTHA